MKVSNIINRNSSDLAFIVGNGINRFNDNGKSVSWDDLLIKLSNIFTKDKIKSIPKGLSNTEFYDLLDLYHYNDALTPNYDIQKEASRILSNWKFKVHHTNFITKAIELETPVLTTNFDSILPDTFNLSIQKIRGVRKFTDFYPWSSYYSNNEIELPTDGFGIWYINGLIKYPRSIRLGLTHYMGSVEKARRYIHKSGDYKLFNGKNTENWKGKNTWLHIIFNKSLFIFGLGLGENEVFLRWLLIERAKYFNKFEERRHKGWYVDLKGSFESDQGKGKKFFLESIGFEIIEINSFEEFYNEFN